MKAGRCCALALLGLGTFAGCRANRGQELLERELRLQEDRIFQLQGQLDYMSTSLEACRRENDALKRDLPGASSRSSSAPNVELPAPSAGRPETIAPGSPPRAPQQAPAGPPNSLPNLDIEPGVEFVPEVEGVPPIDGGTESDSPQLQLNGPSNSGEIQFLPASQRTPDGESADVVKITLNQRLTGGYNADGRPGDEGITVLIEPRDNAGKLVMAPADISIVLVDPLGASGGNRVARWDFRTDEIVHRFQKTIMGEGIYLRLLWPDQRPAAGKVRLFARYATTDGRNLEVSKDIEIHAGDLVAENASAHPAELLQQQGPIHSAMRDAPASTQQAPSGRKRPVWLPFRR